MNCLEIQKKLARFESLTSDELSHIESCSACSAFSKDIKIMRSVHALATPSHIKSRTLKASLKMFEAQPQRQSLVSYFKNLWNSTQAAIILAGFCILALFLTILYQINCDQTDWICRGVSIFLIVVLAQNIIAAICAPLLIKHKKILNY